MAYLKPKNIYGKTYWYVVESRRVNGQMKTVNLAYLGKADDILSRWQRLSTPKDCLKSYSHGAVAVMLSLAKQLGIAEIINTHIQPPSPGSRQRKTPSVGDTLAMAAIGRALHPTSKRIKGWWVGWYESGKLKSKGFAYQGFGRTLSPDKIHSDELQRIYWDGHGLSRFQSW